MTLKNITFIGDSLTEYFDWQERFPSYKARNLGISGETVEELLSRLGIIKHLLSEPGNKPDIIFLMTGINNIAMEDYSIIKSYGEVLQYLSEWFKETKIVVQSVLPVNLSWIDNNAIKLINKMLKEAALNVKADYLDIHSAFFNAQGILFSEYLLDDGVHLSDMGYAKWSQIVEDFLIQKMQL